MTPASCDFIAPLTVATLSQNSVAVDFWNKQSGELTNHVELGMWGDLMVVAPLTANTLSKMVSGGCDNLLLATFLSAKCPVLVAPAMDLDMYAHPSTVSNLKRLEEFGVNIIPAENGALASGLSGQGRMAEPETIFEIVVELLNKSSRLKGTHVLVTAGPTYEAIDPVRFIGNNSSGKMGHEIARNLLAQGAKVTLVAGPTNCSLKHENLSLISVKTAQEMLLAVQEVYENVDGGIFAAAVADYRPVNPANQKIKKNLEEMQISLVKNPDILKWCGEEKKKQWLCGFALETNDALKHGKEKLKRKNLDAIVVNTLEDEGAGFGYDTNKVTILAKDNIQHDFELTTKAQVAKNIVDFLINSVV
jgi:phosphopantothenoylcysteine decarboxylase/phosphopantothenate--cysteine ligase